MSGRLRAGLAACAAALMWAGSAAGGADRQEDTVMRVAMLAIAAPPAPSQGPSRRKVDVVALPEGPLSGKWRAVTQRMTAEQDILVRCRADRTSCDAAAKKFLDLVELGRRREGRAQLGEINRAVNLAIRAMSDLAQHRVEDVWSSPLETFASGAGDCEDYAIAKFAVLRELGIAEEDLRILVVREPGVPDFHAVLAVRFEQRWLVLDNRRFAMINLDDARFNARFALGLQPLATVVAAGADAAVREIVQGESGSRDAPLLL
jgi:predicted transglutaminase-like cysteine proteinase